MQEIKPAIIFDQTFDKDTFTIEQVNSRIHLDSTQQETIRKNWQKYLHEANEKGAKVWDGIHYRLENVNSIVDKLEISTIKYSTIRGLTYNQDMDEIPANSRPNHISTASLIQTLDKYFVFGIRNSNSMWKHKIDFIGGGLQFDEIEVNSCSDIFRNQQIEIEEELGLSQNHIKSMQGIGITLSSMYNVLFIFNTKLSIRKDELLSIFDKNTNDEMINLEFVLESDLDLYLSDKGSYRPLVGKLYFQNKS